MRIAIIDDEIEYQQKIGQICKEFGIQNQCSVDTVSFDSGEAFLNTFTKNSFAIIFMDIYMGGMDRITIASQIRQRDDRCLLIFLTISPEFMAEAFSFHAFEYITKPFTTERVTSVLKDALKFIPASPQYLEIVSKRKTIPELLDDIVTAVTDAHYLEITLTSNATIRCRMTMPDFLRLVEHVPRFISVNKGITLNADHILDFKDSCCILDNGERFPVRVRDRLRIERAVRDYHFAKLRNRQRRGVYPPPRYKIAPSSDNPKWSTDFPVSFPLAALTEHSFSVSHKYIQAAVTSHRCLCNMAFSFISGLPDIIRYKLAL